MNQKCDTCEKEFDNKDAECHCMCCWAENCPACNCNECCEKENERLEALTSKK